MSDLDLIRRIRDGNVNCYEELVNKYQQMIFRVCIGFVHQKDDADDLSQDIFIKVFLALPKFNGKAGFSTWLYRIAINACLNFKRKNCKAIFLVHYGELEEISVQTDRLFNEQDAGADQLLIEKENAEYVHQAIRGLPEKQRVAFVLCKYEDLSQKEIAEIMKLSIGAVEQLLQRAKANLQKQLLVYYKTNYRQI
ncbi:sigma-24 (FecI-like) [Arcticibacter svalbardensis MN12-7]|uniref:Sigma-24 (FecI-like) n=1 Tax=Arcticibacter svalbardensis MN12-7 TaxID=1150600 RepID=R9GNH5_9SPHI|nr:RNA polymerase sigma factor [Arcticibacter svalbardensis]EOR93397.1 sigma-24 (FecI-like) [Arcticibacter svalbardensis MN12-7]